jgi:hypothetical protein
MSRTGELERGATSATVSVMTRAHSAELPADSEAPPRYPEISVPEKASQLVYTMNSLLRSRRRIDVLWALLCENRTWSAEPPPLAQAA